MGSLFVPRGRLRAPVDLHQHEPGGVVLLLHHVKPRDTRLYYALPGIVKRDSPKSLNGLRLHMRMDVNNEHASMLQRGDLPRREHVISRVWQRFVIDLWPKD